MAVSLFGLGLLLAPAHAQSVPPPPGAPEWRKPAGVEPPPLPSIPPLPPAPVPLTSRLDEVFKPRPSDKAPPAWKGYGTTQPVQHAYPVPPGSIQQVTQPPTPAFEGAENVPSLESPSQERLFRLDTERTLRDRMRQEALSRPEPSRIVFPEEPVVSKDRYLGRRWPRMAEKVEPGYVTYKRLLFEQKNAERYGWSLGYLHPLISTAIFYKDALMLPYNMATRPWQQWESDAGYALPGDPQPLLLYPTELSLTGLAAEAGAITGLFFIFP